MFVLFLSVKVKEMVPVQDEHLEVSRINHKYHFERDLAISSMRVVGMCFILMLVSINEKNQKIIATISIT